MTTEPVAPSPARPPAAPPASGPAITPAPRRPRRPRPVLLLASGLVLGTVAGTGVGYAIQSGRPPTPLPQLQVALPTYPSEVVDPTAAAAAAPSPLAIEGDLRKLLVTAPGGSKPWDDQPDKPSWITVGELADRTRQAADIFNALNQQGFRRAAAVAWSQGGLGIQITLTQFKADFASKADNARWNKGDYESFAPEANGGFRIENTPAYWAETTDLYYLGLAVAQRGTVLMEVRVFGTKPVDAEVVKNLAKQQWERLV
ncbi:hypothetical protein [Kitasatospora purpeofusca]|uniref:hypothetical protein n=1 Tax=Kitasatospora purpeofusca TaxID=67352 RepID=UPI0038688908|nr:hypothetical protein OIP63_38910 [Kitasatospora purpeofusca]